MLADPAGALGAALQIPMHAVAKMTLFMCAGAIYVATGKTNISDMKGLGRKMPLVFSAFLIASLSIIGIPPLGGDWAKYELLQGAIDGHHLWVEYVFIASSMLNIAYLLPISLLAFFPPPDKNFVVAEYKRPGGAPALTVLPLCITAAGCFVLFFAVDPIMEFLKPVVGVR